MKDSKWRRRLKQKRISAHLERVNLFAAGIDIGSQSHYVAVPAELDDEPVREFSCFTGDLNRMADWLVGIGIKTVAMESTGVYWIPAFEILEERGLEVLLVNARHVKNVPGRKSDVQDCQWLHSFIPTGCWKGHFVHRKRRLLYAPTCVSVKRWFKARQIKSDICKRRYAR
jgi:hypothetical protein